MLIGGLLGKLFLFFLNVGVNWETFMILAAEHGVPIVKIFWGIFIISAAGHELACMPSIVSFLVDILNGGSFC